MISLDGATSNGLIDIIFNTLGSGLKSLGSATVHVAADVVGIGGGLASGYSGNPRMGAISCLLASAPEFYDFVINPIIRSENMASDALPLYLIELLKDSAFIGACYFVGYVAGRRRHQKE